MNRGKRTIRFARPGDTVTVSLTGPDCARNCAHCGGHWLGGMSRLDKVLAAARAGRVRSVLVSGGCDKRGRVPWREFLPQLTELATYCRLNFHTGLIEPEDVPHLARLAAAVSLDMVGDRETVREVYGLDREPEHWFESYRLLVQSVPVVPHLCIGLRGGRLSGEDKVLDFLAREGPASLTLLVFIPTPGTAYQRCSPPPLADVRRVMARAREMLPETNLTLGCMRPGGRYRAQLDQMAVRLGFDGIVRPAPPAQQLAVALGLEILVGRECCAL